MVNDYLGVRASVFLWCSKYVISEDLLILNPENPIDGPKNRDLI